VRLLTLALLFALNLPAAGSTVRDLKIKVLSTMPRRHPERNYGTGTIETQPLPLKLLRLIEQATGI